MRALKVYLAAPYPRKDDINQFATELRARGIIVTSRWLDEVHAPTTQLAEVPPADNQKYAQQDIEDIVSADILVLWADPTKKIIRAGRHVEFGIAVAIGLTRPFPIFVVGEERENIFQYLTQVQHFPTWDSARQRICQLAEIE